MMDVQSAPELEKHQPPPDSEALLRNLDDLLERYLNLVHDYTTTQHALSKDFSSVCLYGKSDDSIFQGYLSLAQANFSNPSRTRYGQDFYDDRMKASVRLSIASPPPDRANTDPIEQLLRSPTSITLLQLTSKSPNAEDEEKAEKSGEDNDTAPELPVSDPLKWFGILVAPALRSSQASFKAAITERVPRLVNVSNEMKGLEIEIRRARKKIKKAG
ncbi:MAG: hypothetical protein Q9183_002114 [Haloplaca sp. 2 TL-2023]